MGYPDFNEFLHALRTRELQRIPPGGKIFLSAGCSGRWYFDWISGNYPGITKHLGIEAYSTKPDDLPAEAVWLADYLYNIKSVGDQEVDLVFAGQTVEHLWPDDLAGFLSEAHRTLKPDGLIVLDSPNRFVSQAINWYHAEHTMEFTIDEISKLLTLAGFVNIEIKGVWLCYNRNNKTFLPLSPDLENINIDNDYRVIEAKNHPEDSFIWWAEAKKDASRAPNREELSTLTNQIYDRVFHQALQRVFTYVGEYNNFGDVRGLLGSRGKVGFLRHGPYVPLLPGNYKVQFRVGYISSSNAIIERSEMEKTAFRLDISSDMGRKTLAEKDILVCQLIQKPEKFSKPLVTIWGKFKKRILLLLKKLLRIPNKEVPQPVFQEFEIPISLDKVEFGVEFRILTYGILNIVADPLIKISWDGKDL